jgi:hypothetical protein
VLIIPSSWGSQRAVLTRHQAVFWRHCRGGRRLLQGESRMHNLLLCLLFCFILFLLAPFYQKYKKISFLYSCFYLLAFSFARMGTPKNTKLCDFTSTKNNDFICTPIAPPAPEANFYEIKPALLNLVMKEQFFVPVLMILQLISTILLSYVRCKSIRM